MSESAERLRATIKWCGRAEPATEHSSEAPRAFFQFPSTNVANYLLDNRACEHHVYDASGRGGSRFTFPFDFLASASS